MLRFKAQGVGKGDNVTIYLPMIVELPVAMLACARIGAVHSVVFGGFSSEAPSHTLPSSNLDPDPEHGAPQALADRIVDGKPKVIVTADGVMRGPKPIFLKVPNPEPNPDPNEIFLKVTQTRTHHLYTEPEPRASRVHRALIACT